jgi:hypothetical protein
MDDIVKQAMAKWPNVPNCYGWLALDARGHWRLRDQRTQDLDLPGDRLAHAALIAFINRNYARDERGCWFFQNGPQRVYVNLETAPYISTVAGDGVLTLHTGAPLERIDEALMTRDGALILVRDDVAAQLDDRDLAQVLGRLRLDDAEMNDEALLGWLESDTPRGTLTLLDGDRAVPVMRIATADVAAHCRFVRRPAP